MFPWLITAEHLKTPSSLNTLANKPTDSLWGVVQFIVVNVIWTEGKKDLLPSFLILLVVLSEHRNEDAQVSEMGIKSHSHTVELLHPSLTHISSKDVDSKFQICLQTSRKNISCLLNPSSFSSQFNGSLLPCSCLLWFSKAGAGCSWQDGTGQGTIKEVRGRELDLLPTTTTNHTACLHIFTITSHLRTYCF